MNETLVSHVSDTARWVAIYRAWESARADALFRDPGRCKTSNRSCARPCGFTGCRYSCVPLHYCPTPIRESWEMRAGRRWCGWSGILALLDARHSLSVATEVTPQIWATSAIV
jgi:hypothetical protein